jgi:hypothetical protein
VQDRPRTSGDACPAVCGLPKGIRLGCRLGSFGLRSIGQWLKDHWFQILQVVLSIIGILVMSMRGEHA